MSFSPSPSNTNPRSIQTARLKLGLIAEEVEKINPDLVVHDDQRAIYTVRYEAVNAMLLNEFLKEHYKVQSQQEEIQKLKEEIAEQKETAQRTEARFKALETAVSQLTTHSGL